MYSNDIELVNTWEKGKDNESRTFFTPKKYFFKKVGEAVGSESIHGGGLEIFPRSFYFQLQQLQNVHNMFSMVSRLK